MVTKTHWGRAQWFMLHSLAAMIPTGDSDSEFTKSQISELIQYIRITAKVLPCGVCSNHAIKYINDNPPETACVDNESCQKYIYEWHNSANGKSETDSDVPPFEEVKKAFNPRAVFPDDKFNYFGWKVQVNQDGTKSIVNQYNQSDPSQNGKLATAPPGNKVQQKAGTNKETTGNGTADPLEDDGTAPTDSQKSWGVMKWVIVAVVTSLVVGTIGVLLHRYFKRKRRDRLLKEEETRFIEGKSSSREKGNLYNLGDY